MSAPVNTRRHPKAEPVEAPWLDPRLDAGIQLFNDGQHWHAHEEWEGLWLGLEGDDKLFVQGLIMAAALLVQYGRGRIQGVINHWANVQARLPQHAPEKWGIDVQRLLDQLVDYAEPVIAGDASVSLDPANVRIHRAP